MSALSMNRVCLAGYLTRDPALRKTNGGTPVADVGLAMNEEYTTKDGKTVQQTCFVDLVLWGKTASASGEFLKKGNPVLVEGRLETDQWETAQGEKRSKLRVRAMRVHFLNGGRRNGPEDGKASAPAPAEASESDPFALP
jgi:single-strand DNA-binding protein